MDELSGYSMCDECYAIVPDSKMDLHDYFHSRFEALFDKVWNLED